MTTVLRNGTAYTVTKAYQNGQEYLLNGGYVGWPYSWITIKGTPFGYNTHDSVQNLETLSVVTGNKLFWFFIWKYYDSSDVDYTNVAMAFTKLPWQDFVYTRIADWHYESSSWWTYERRRLINGSNIKILAAYYARVINDIETTRYDIYDIDVANATVTLSWNASIGLDTSQWEWFSTCDASKFGYDGYTDYTGTVPWFINGWFTSPWIVNYLTPKFVLA